MTNNPIPPQVIEKWQAEFEQLLRERYPHLSLNKTPLDKYAYMGTEALWQGFLLARSTIEIPLPAVKDYASTMCSLKEILAFNLGKNMTAAKIESQGYRVKE